LCFVIIHFSGSTIIVCNPRSWQITNQPKIKLADPLKLLSMSKGGYRLADSYSRAITRAGFTWGDNVGDSINIMNGWDYGEKNY
jgi:hypothetical protein